MQFFASCPPGVADLLATELKEFGGTQTREIKTGVYFEGTLETAYRACLWSRTANRVLMPIGEADATTAQALYAGVQAIDWFLHLDTSGTLAIDFAGSSTGITHTHFGAMKTKDAIVDQFRDRFGERPSIDVERPDVRINVHLTRDRATLAIDLSGESLHRRGYRLRGVAAPLKENLAAAILLRSGWPAIAREKGGFVDPMCGSGTLVIEAAYMAQDIAPGLGRDYFGFLRWKGHDAILWTRLHEEASERRAQGGAQNAGRVLRGYDAEPQAVRAAIENAGRAGLTGSVHFERRDLRDLVCEHPVPGLVAANPPYGERIGDVEALKGLYAELGSRLREQFVGWRAVVFTGNPRLAREIGIHARRSHTLFNGLIECRLLRFDVAAEHFDTPETRPTEEDKLAVSRQRPGAQMFGNRLAKNFKTLRTWARRSDVYCYRVYDADMPEYSFAIDIYGNGEAAGQHVYVQEYAPPDSVDREGARLRRWEALSVIPEVIGVPRERMHVRTRRPQKGATQYEKVDEQREFHRVREGAYEFLVNFTDYLDTGLFLDHRLTRARVGELAAGKRFLNLFAYTGSVTVYAAGCRAATTTTVDMSRTYLDWAKRNLALNKLAGPEHGFVQADCLQWLAEESERGHRAYDLIFIDPPTFSRSKRMEDDFEVQRDHVGLLQQAARLLAPGGAIVFSNNYTRFRLDTHGLAGFIVEDVTRSTIPKDFERNARIHCCFMLTPKAIS